MPVLIAKDAVREPLWAVVPVHNAWRFKSRWKHTDRAIKHFIDSGAVVVLVEVAFNRREFVYADSGLNGTPANCGLNGGEFRHVYVPLRSSSELWLKENMINVGVAHIPDPNWEQVCWLDSDVHFVRPNWVGECIHKLQHYSFLQMFSQAQDLGPTYEMLPSDYAHASGISWVKAWQDGIVQSTVTPEIREDLRKIRRDIRSIHRDVHTLHKDFIKLEFDLLGGVYPYGPGPIFPGLAWACTRKAWDDVGGLLDIAIWGGGDWHMSHALIEKTEGMMRDDLHRNYKKLVNQWYQRCRTHIRRNVGMMEGAVFHNWHGRKTGRGYNTKHALLSAFGFDPLRHLKRDSQNLWQLHDDRSIAFVQLRDMLRRIAKERDEDSNYTGLGEESQGH
jgi:hypothetical protein